MVALAHGTNDAQKTMGIITLSLITAGVLAPDSAPPFWVILSAGLAIALGTYLGGWRIIRTLGKRVSEIQTPQGFAAETSAGGHPHLLAPRVRPVDHAGRHRRDLRRRCRAPGGLGALGRRGPDGRGVAAHPAGRSRGRRGGGAWLASTGTVGTIVVALVLIAVCRPGSTPRRAAAR